jgi:hypothetical protein
MTVRRDQCNEPEENGSAVPEPEKKAKWIS